jgi:hypothetical protein
MTKFDELPKAYATLRFAGDGLDPADISAVLPVAPIRAHRKGESFYAGPRAGNLIGRTGIWYYAPGTWRAPISPITSGASWRWSIPSPAASNVSNSSAM